MSMIGKSIRYFRTRKRLSLDALAGWLGMSKMALSYYENDKRLPPMDTLRRICEILDISGVSDPCIFLRARLERIISESYFKNLMDAVQSNADPIWNERPTMMEQLVCRAYSKGLVTRSKASELLDVPYDEAVKLLA